MKKINSEKIAYVLGKISPSMEKESMHRLNQLDSVSEAHLVAGKFDFVAKISFDNFDSFFESYLQLKRIPSIEARKILIANRHRAV